MSSIKTIVDPNGHVAKFIFTDDVSITEVVAYRYNARGVVCFSTMSGCPVGCKFCGTGKRFIKNLSYPEMIYQIETALKWIGRQSKIQIMAMSMGEPMMTWEPVQSVATHYLMLGYSFYISTVGIFNSVAQDGILKIAERHGKFGLQVSLHSVDQEYRNELLGKHPLALTLHQIKRFSLDFEAVSGNPVYFNYICVGNETEQEAERVAKFVGQYSHLTCSVLCNTGEFTKADPAPALRFGKMCHEHGVRNWSVFDPAGQDTIGGGCGQLLYVQEFLNKKS